MKIRLIDVDGHNFPNLPLMKLSAWHKQQNDDVDWYDPLTDWQEPPDRVYMSKVFTFTPDYQYPVNAQEIIRGGTGYFYPGGAKTYRRKWSTFTQTTAYIQRRRRIRLMAS